MNDSNNTLFLDCSTGASGDMLLAALFDLGLDFEKWAAVMSSLSLAEKPEFIVGEKYARGVRAKTFRVVAKNPPSARTLSDMEKILADSALPESTKSRSSSALRRLAECEAAIHGCSIQEVHFHELGGLDTVADVAGAFLALEMLGVSSAAASPVNVGSGMVKCDHGLMPVPAPATAKLLEGAAIFSLGQGELTTPTGALLVTEIAASFGDMPKMKLSATGCGTGTRDYPNPSLFRALLGSAQHRHGHHSCGHADGDTTMISANIDDMDPRIAGYLIELLLESGALDAFSQPVYMKKNRPGFILNALCEPENAGAIADIFLRETTTLGVRMHSLSRRCMERSTTTVETAFGPIRVKAGMKDGRVEKVNPEYEDCAAAARKSGAPLREVMDAAKAAAEEKRKREE